MNLKNLFHITACDDCQRGHCCGSCWCCYDKRNWLTKVITAARRLAAIERSREYFIKQII